MFDDVRRACLPSTHWPETQPALLVHDSPFTPAQVPPAQTSELQSSLMRHGSPARPMQVWPSLQMPEAQSPLPLQGAPGSPGAQILLTHLFETQSFPVLQA